MPVSRPPAQLKSLVPFITRAHQIEKTDPVIAYWCYYWAVQLVLSQNLHSGDHEATGYTTALLDDLETRKEKLLPNDAITDDLAAQAYLENFALKVFRNADNALQARKVSRQTADNFLAAATFLELCKISPNVDPEILSKIKFSKYQASRIIKAFQAGEDPNLPLPEQTEVVSPPDQSQKQGTGVPISPPKPTVEDVEDEDEESKLFHPSHRVPSPLTSPPTPPQRVSPQSSATSDRLPLHYPSSFPDQDFFPTIPVGRPFSPLSPDNTSTNTPAGVMSPFHMPAHAGSLPQPPPADTIQAYTDEVPQLQYQQQYPSAPVPTQLPPQHFDQSSILNTNTNYLPPPAPNLLPAHSPSAPHQYYSTPPPPAAPQPTYVAAPRPVAQSGYGNPPQALPQQQVLDEESIAQAQKHAKWAISALNYDDVPTAVKELQIALRLLGAG